MGFFSSMAPNNHLNHDDTTKPFMTCIVKVDTQSQWQKTVSRLLKKCHGVHSFGMDQSGMVEISGTVDPSLLLRMLERAGRSAELCWFQFGECSSNLFMPTTNSYNCSRNGRYLQAPNNLSRPSISNNQNHVFDHRNRYYDYNHYQSGHSHGGNQFLDYDNRYYNNNINGGNQIQNRNGDDGEDISCCTVL